MKWSFRLARFAGIDVRVHGTFLLLLAWFGMAYYADGGFGAMMLGLSFIVLLFVCVVLHEFGHALAARSYGIGTHDITLLPIGGVARLERMPDKPWQEFVVALAGPAVNVVIAFALYVVVGREFHLQDVTAVDQGGGDILSKLLAINIILVVFNLMPAFPMDGGRILRALLATRLKYARATRIAAVIGQIVAVLFGLLGLFGNPMLLFIAVFVFFGAQQEALQATAKESFGEARVSQVMQPLPPVFTRGTTVLQAVQLAMRDARNSYPLADSGLRLIGLVPAGELALALNGRATDMVDTLARGGILTLPVDATLAEARAKINSSAQQDFPVTNAANQLVGYLSREDLPAGFLERDDQAVAMYAPAKSRTRVRLNCYG
ncbi:MAG: site-2 protease family protein [Chthoniobacterales bacterium]|nr:site-2 protease family protein [Chthoniobacterales bacterium]